MRGALFALALVVPISAQQAEAPPDELLENLELLADGDAFELLLEEEPSAQDAEGEEASFIVMEVWEEDGPLEARMETGEEEGERPEGAEAEFEDEEPDEDFLGDEDEGGEDFVEDDEEWEP